MRCALPDINRAWRSAGMILRIDWPIISSGEKPKTVSAAAFQLLTMPFKTLLTIGSYDDFTIAARSASASFARCCSLMSRMMVDAPLICPAPSRTGESVTETLRSFPALLTRIVS